MSDWVEFSERSERDSVVGWDWTTVVAILSADSGKGCVVKFCGGPEAYIRVSSAEVMAARRAWEQSKMGGKS